MKSLRLWWTGAEWRLFVATTLSPAQIRAIAEWALPRQTNRWRGLPPSEHKEELARALEKLARAEIVQVLYDHDRDGVVVPFNTGERSRPQLTTVYLP